MLIDYIIARARRTPYFHLEGYMERYWLVPYRSVIERVLTYRPVGSNEDERLVMTDGTGPVSPFSQPFAWLLQKFDIAVRVHHILRSDHGRDPHDHPWPYLTIVLRGGYLEHQYDEAGFWKSANWRGAGSVLWRPAKSLHRLEVPEGQTAWTLFFTGRKQQTWGFKPVVGPKIPYYEYKDEQ